MLGPRHSKLLEENSYDDNMVFVRCRRSQERASRLDLLYCNINHILSVYPGENGLI